MENHKVVALQWVPVHCGLQGNEIADSLARKATKIAQVTDQSIAFYTAKQLVKKVFYREILGKHERGNKDKKWIEKVTNIPLRIKNRSVAFFRLATSHACFSKHLYHIEILPSPLCRLCNIREEMDGNHSSQTVLHWARYTCGRNTGEFGSRWIIYRFTVVLLLVTLFVFLTKVVFYSAIGNKYIPGGHN
ncbi:uncharacterized protein LOC118187641 [Stegodyphus dumicola]|uniref:uncharacterized protein LOC118187641 n=1 Tax=Stegodyphus dumicola TaxID=202533 RepID=UPI0015A9E34D|nr:uncharacterized protein LOC118187641 [Stegodyphus dumicola]